MDLAPTLKKLKENLPELECLGVKSLAVLGSIARNEATPTRDIDILVEFGRPVGLFDFVRLKTLLEKYLDRQVDLVTPDALRTELRGRILDEAVYVR